MLPRSMDDISFLMPYVTTVVEHWLTKLIGADRLKDLTDWLNTESNDTPIDETIAPVYPADLYALVEVFLVYAAWADYVLVGSVLPTTTGLVVKDEANSTPVSDAQRTQMHRYYKGLAEDRATTILDFLSKLDKACEPENTGTAIRFSVARGRTESLFQ